MANVNPLLLVGAVIGVVTALLVLAYALVKDKKETMDFERTMNDGEILRRLAGYAKPYWAKFVVVLFLMLFSIAYDIISPLIIGALEELVSGEFELPRLFAGVAVYAGVLVFSMASTYFQAVILQRVGQRIISDLREDLFTHIVPRAAERDSRRQARHPRDERYERYLDDVHEPAGHADQEHLCHPRHPHRHAVPQL